MALVQIEQVSIVPLESSEVVAFAIDQPAAGDTLSGYAIKIQGWILTRETKPISVLASWKGEPFGKGPLRLPRPDLAAAHPDFPRAGESGFAMVVSLLGLATDASISLDVKVFEGGITHIADIHVKRSPLHLNYVPSTQPVLLTSLGRSGSTWLMTLLGRHPATVALQPSRLEPRAIHYWMTVFRTLSNPNSYLQILAADLSQPRFWLGETPPIHMPDSPLGGAQQWLYETSIERIGAFCQQQIDAFYQQAALEEQKPDVCYFVEKHVPDRPLSMLIRELYSQSREIFLVRDLRDMFCSMMAFNAKSGRLMFQSDRSTTNDEFIRSIRVQSLAMLDEWQSRSAESYLLKYEDLIQSPEPAVAGVLNYIGVSSESAVVKRMIQEAGGFDTRGQQTAADPNSSMGRWRRDLSPELQTLCIEAFGEIMRQFGYP